MGDFLVGSAATASLQPVVSNPIDRAALPVRQDPGELWVVDQINNNRDHFLLEPLSHPRRRALTEEEQARLGQLKAFFAFGSSSTSRLAADQLAYHVGETGPVVADTGAYVHAGDRVRFGYEGKDGAAHQTRGLVVSSSPTELSVLAPDEQDALRTFFFWNDGSARAHLFDGEVISAAPERK